MNEMNGVIVLKVATVSHFQGWPYLISVNPSCEDESKNNPIYALRNVLVILKVKSEF